VLSIVADILTTLFIDLVLHVPTTAVNIVLSLLAVTVLALVVWRVEIFLISMESKADKSENTEGKPRRKWKILKKPKIKSGE